MTIVRLIQQALSSTLASLKQGVKNQVSLSRFRMQMLRWILSSRIDEFQGRRITERESGRLKQELRIAIPQAFIDILIEFPITGCYFELPESLDLSGMGVEMKWMTPSQIVSESTEVYPGIAAASKGYLPVGSCMIGSGDYYFLDLNNSELPLVRIPHTAVERNGELMAESIELVCLNLADFLVEALGKVQ